MSCMLIKSLICSAPLFVACLAHADVYVMHIRPPTEREDNTPISCVDLTYKVYFDSDKMCAWFTALDKEKRESTSSTDNCVSVSPVDFNGDGAVNNFDVGIFRSYLGN